MGSSTTRGVVLAAGAVLLSFYGQEYVESNVLCLGAAIDAIRDTQPLGSDAIERDVGLPTNCSGPRLEAALAAPLRDRGHRVP